MMRRGSTGMMMPKPIVSMSSARNTNRIGLRALTWGESEASMAAQSTQSL